MRKSVIAVLMLAGVMLANDRVLFAQDSANSTVTDQDVQLLRKDLRSQKKQLIAANLPLTDAEAVKFWPVYDQYQTEITKIGNTRFALIKEYAANYNTLTDAQAHDLITRTIGVDESLCSCVRSSSDRRKSSARQEDGDVFPNGKEGCVDDRSSVGVDDPNRATVGKKRESRGCGPEFSYSGLVSGQGFAPKLSRCERIRPSSRYRALF